MFVYNCWKPISSVTRDLVGRGEKQKKEEHNPREFIEKRSLRHDPCMKNCDHNFLTWTGINL